MTPPPPAHETTLPLQLIGAFKLIFPPLTQNKAQDSSTYTRHPGVFAPPAPRRLLAAPAPPLPAGMEVFTGTIWGPLLHYYNDYNYNATTLPHCYTTIRLPPLLTLTPTPPTPLGMAATIAVVTGTMKAGDHCVITDCSYGGTNRACRTMFTDLGMTFDFIDFRARLYSGRRTKQTTVMAFVAVRSLTNTTMFTDLGMTFDFIDFRVWRPFKRKRAKDTPGSGFHGGRRLADVLFICRHATPKENLAATAQAHP